MGSLRQSVAERARWVGVFAALLLLVGSVPVLAESSAEQSQDGAVVAVPAEPEAFDHAAVAIGLEKAEQEKEEQEEERAEELETPEAIAEREASQLAYEDHDSAAEASALLRDFFEAELANIDADPARVITDSALKQSLDGEGAVVSSEGQPELIEANVPAKVAEESGELSKVDLDLEATARRV